MRLVTFISSGAFIVCSAFMMKKDSSKENNTLFSTKWQLKKIHTTTGIEVISTAAFIKFDKAKKSAGGNGSCNNFGGSFTLDKNKISIQNIFSTKMYCEGVQQTEDVYFSLLQKVNNYVVKDKMLLLYLDKELMLVFESE